MGAARPLIGRRDLIGLSCGVILAATVALIRPTRSVYKITNGVPEGDIGLFSAIRKRRSIRRYTDEDVSMDDIRTLCWAAQGITCPVTGYRASPSAGATFPLDIFAAMPSGILRYRPESGELEEVSQRDVRWELSASALHQPWIRNAAVDIVVCSDHERTTARYGERGMRYVYMEVGHASQNILLASVALGLGAVPIGAFDEKGIANAVGIGPPHEPVYIISIGHPAETSCGTEGEQL